MARNQYIGEIVGGLLDELQSMEDRLKKAVEIIAEKDRQIAELQQPEKYLDE